MKLIHEIIELLSKEGGSLEDVLIKTKILAHKLGEKKLSVWVNSELNGYQASLGLPEYRVVPTRVRVTATDGYRVRWKNQNAPLNHIDEKIKNNLTKQKFTESISALQHLISNEGGTLARPLPPEICPLISEGLGEGVYAESAYVEIGKSQVVQILTQIRSRLLDFVLELSTQLPDEINEEEIKMVSKKIGAENLFNNAVFGDNTTIIVGDKNKQIVTNEQLTNNFENLAEFLRQHNIQEGDINSLSKNIEKDSDLVDHDNRVYGPNVKSWLKSMMSKAVDASWKIELGMASSLLSAALNSYYGWF